MSVSEYVMAFVTIVLGLAITDLLFGLQVAPFLTRTIQS